MIFHIIYDNFLKPNGTEMSIGGIQTYLTELVQIINDLGAMAVVHQRADVDFVKQLSLCTVHGYKLVVNRNMRRNLIDRALNFIDQNNDIVIFGCETNAVKKLKCKTIGIQHGVFWDKPGDANISSIHDAAIFLKKSFKAFQTAKRIKQLDELICVDYNFVNWYRAQVNYPKVNLQVIPNFCKVPDEYPIKHADSINIIFARRFFPYRGTRIFADAISKIVDEYPQVHVTIAGSGPDESYLKTHLQGQNYEYVTYSSKDTFEIHRDKHIALVPTLGSEGTSLSLLEAMAAGCAPICTNVGGMTNIIIDSYNGLMISPTAEDLYKAMKSLIKSPQLREQLSEKAYETANLGFNYNKWRTAWYNILSHIQPINTI